MILLDTDVILDVVLDRAPHAEASSRLLDHIQRDPGVGAFVAWHTLSNLSHLLRPTSGSGDAYIATRNTKDFERSPVPARTPQELLELLGDTKP